MQKSKMRQMYCDDSSVADGIDFVIVRLSLFDRKSFISTEIFDWQKQKHECVNSKRVDKTFIVPLCQLNIQQ